MSAITIIDDIIGLLGGSGGVGGNSPAGVPNLLLWLDASEGAKSGLAAEFTLANSEVLSINDNASLRTGDISFTVATWVYLTTKAANAEICGKWRTGGDLREWRITYNLTADRFRFLTSSDGTSSGVQTLGATTFGSPSTGTWYFIVVQHDAANNTKTISINNGTVDSVSYSSGITAGAGGFTYGAQETAASTFNEHLDGRADATGFWKRILTAAEITTLYNSGSGLSYSDLPGSMKDSLISWWDFNEVSGTRNDRHGTNHLTDNNTVTSVLGLVFGSALDGDTVRRWNNRASASWNGSQTTISLMPIYQANAFNGLPGIRFDGTDDYISVAENLNFSSAVTNTIFAVAKKISSGAGRRTVYNNSRQSQFASSGSSTQSIWLLRQSGAVILFRVQDTTTAYDSDAAEPADGVPFLCCGIASTTSQLFQNGTDGGASATDASLIQHASEWVRVGARTDPPPSDYWAGDISEIIVIDGTATRAQRKAIERYLGQKYSISVAND